MSVINKQRVNGEDSHWRFYELKLHQQIINDQWALFQIHKIHCGKPQHRRSDFGCHMKIDIFAEAESLMNKRERFIHEQRQKLFAVSPFTKFQLQVFI